MISNESWALDSSSRYFFREWEDGVTLFLEGENSIFLINPFAAYLLRKFNSGQQSFQELLDHICAVYPGESISTLKKLLENTLAELGQRGILIRMRL